MKTFIFLSLILSRCFASAASDATNGEITDAQLKQMAQCLHFIQPTNLTIAKAFNNSAELALPTSESDLIFSDNSNRVVYNSKKPPQSACDKLKAYSKFISAIAITPSSSHAITAQRSSACSNVEDPTFKAVLANLKQSVAASTQTNGGAR